MTKYQEEFYKFVVDPENFDAICDMVDNFADVREKLIYDFWTDVKIRCEELLTSNRGWKVYISEFDGPDPEITLYREEFYTKDTHEECEFSISIGASSSVGIYGLWFCPEPIIFNKDKLLKIAKENKIIGWKYGSNFPYYKYFPEDFSELSSLKKIHPNNRNSLVQQYANDLMDAIKDLEPFINKHILKAK